MKKITILISDISKSGGTERASINLANLLTNDYQVEILSLHNKQEHIATFYDVDNRVILSSLRLDIRSTIVNTKENYKSLKNYFSLNKADFIVGTWYGVNILLPFFKSKNSKVVACEHADFNTTPKTIKKIAKFLYPKLNALVMLSNVAKSKMLSYNKNVVVIPNSLPFETELISNLDYKRILMVGRLMPVKGYERIIPLALFLKEKYPNWTIDIFGDGELRESLLHQIEEANLKNVILHQSVKDIKKEYLESAFYLSTSYNEAMPMVFLEAMSCGLPVVSYKNEGAECLVSNNIDGMLVNNSEELIQKCEKLIENIEYRRTLGKNGKEKSKEYSSENIKKLWLQLLNKI